MTRKAKKENPPHAKGSEAKTTTDQNTIRKWVEERGGHPSTVKRTMEGDQPGLLRIDFPGYSGETTLQEISWEAFFDKFEHEQLAFLYQETTEGKESRFCKIISRS